MPKYKPTLDDMYETNPCFICGDYVLNEGDETCSDICRVQKEYFDEDWGLFLWNDYEDLEDDLV